MVCLKGPKGDHCCISNQGLPDEPEIHCIGPLFLKLDILCSENVNSIRRIPYKNIM